VRRPIIAFLFPRKFPMTLIGRLAWKAESGVAASTPVFGVSPFLPRMAATLLSLFGLPALLLAAIGLYGAMSYSVSQHTREIGIRISIGAQRRDVLRLVMGQGLILSSIGIVIGLVAALGVTSLIAICSLE
jgi:putative ABC transport system permease protein